jgi:predicted Zn-dependent protease
VQHDARFQLREVLPSGAIQRCRITLDPDVDSARNNIAVTIRHEIGHCLGFIGHVASGLMSPRCCQTTITAEVRDMLRQLYSLPPGTEVTP